MINDEDWFQVRQLFYSVERMKREAIDVLQQVGRASPCIFKEGYLEKPVVRGMLKDGYLTLIDRDSFTLNNDWALATTLEIPERVCVLTQRGKLADFILVRYIEPRREGVACVA